MDELDLLSSYRQKRDFTLTPEPSHRGKSSPLGLTFVVQKHWASNLHYDFRLQFDGVLKSWAIPKGPSLDPHVKRMAVQVEDHPLSYGDFEGLIPAKQYGAGRVIVWDRGVWLPIFDAVQGFKDGKLKFELHGHKLKGRWTLVRMRSDGEKQIAWLLIKEHDEFEKAAAEYDITEALPDRVKTSGEEDVASGTKTVPVKSKTAKAQSRPQKVDLPRGAVKASLPGKLAPQLATLVDLPPEHGEWRYEVKFDGYRLMTRLGEAGVQCFTRNGHDWTAKLPQLAESLSAMAATGAWANTWLDGEIVVPNANGIPDFHLLQKALETRSSVGASSVLSTASAASIVYYVFDLPFYNGCDLRAVPFDQRRALLQGLLEPQGSSKIKFSAAFEAPPNDLMRAACKLGLEGLIGKRVDSIYQSRRSPDWVKLKCRQLQAFLIGGYTEPKGARVGFGALLLGERDNSGALQYAGNVGSGFSEKTLSDLKRLLEKLAIPESPFAGKPSIAGTPHWVKPTLLANVSFAELTNTGRIRHGVFRGFSDETKPLSKKAGVAAVNSSQMPVAPAKKSHAAGVMLPASLRLTNPDRVIDVQSGLTKLDMVKHYAAVAAAMIPHLKGRPVSLVRAPSGTQGELFFQKHAKPGEIPAVKLLDPALDPGHARLLEISTLAALLSAAQMNSLEFHTWNGVAASINKPDRMVFDLDPGEKVAWPDIQEAALLVRTLLDALGLVPFIKTSGGKGVHVVVPIKKQHDWDTVKGFSRTLVQHLALTIPQKFVAKSGPKNRVGKIFVDYLRNGFGATTASAWSARARPGLGVSVPIAWEELPTLTGSAQWTVENLSDRIAVGNSVWNGYSKSARGLGASMRLLDYKTT